MDAKTAALFPDSFEDSEIGEVPKGWATTPFSDLLTPRNERAGDLVLTEYSSTNEGLFPRSDRFKKQLAVSTSKNKVIRQGDLVFGLSREVLNFGLMRDEIGSVSGAYKVFAVNADVFASDLLEQTMRSRPQYYYGAVSASSREGQSVSADSLLRLLVAVPPVCVQNAFYSIAKQLTEAMDSLAAQSRTLAALRDTLLPKLLSGEVRVPEAERAVEEVLG
jgi:type I restriction enzyme S subunit